MLLFGDGSLKVTFLRVKIRDYKMFTGMRKNNDKAKEE